MLSPLGLVLNSFKTGRADNSCCIGYSCFNLESGLVRNPKQDVFVPAFKARLEILNEPLGLKFSNEAMNEKNPKWNNAISRVLQTNLPEVWGNDFEIDKNLIMNTEGYDRLRYKTMVYPLPQNDMVLTRSAHVAQVANVSRTIAKQLGLNTDLVQAIAHGHDIGHSPFGHDGERALKKICAEFGLEPFWHEKNGVRMVDKFLLNYDKNGANNNLNLTYAVRDGIISHCGEVNDNLIKPRNEYFDLNAISKPAQYQPYTWEGVVVKISDKISYLGRDVEDAVRLGFYNEKNLKELQAIVKKTNPEFQGQVNNASLADLFIKDIVKNSSPLRGIGLSQGVAEVMDSIKKYNMEHIYVRDDVRLISQSQTNNILATVFKYYDSLYKGSNTIQSLAVKKDFQNACFRDWLVKYTDSPFKNPSDKNETVYDLRDRTNYRQAIIDYISGMTDSFAIKTYNAVNKDGKAPYLMNLLLH